MKQQKSKDILDDYISNMVEQKKTLSARAVYTHFHKNGIEMSMTEIGIRLRNTFNSNGMPGYTMEHLEKNDRLEQIYWYKRGWFYSIYKLLGGK